MIIAKNTKADSSLAMPYKYAVMKKLEVTV